MCEISRHAPAAIIVVVIAEIPAPAPATPARKVGRKAVAK
jgi:hypothetical protein